MNLIDQSFGIQAKALQLRSQRLDLIASNIANAATPGFKARDLDFTAALNGASIASATKYRIPAQLSLDGNTVELSTEQVQFAQNAVQYRSTLAFLGGRIGTLMSALRGE